MSKDIYTKQIKVKAEHIDQLKHVNNVVYLQWVQDIAKEHWQSKKLVEFDQQYSWMVVDHFLQYKSQAFLGELISIHTYIEKNAGVKSTRIVEFWKEDKLLVKATTNWALIELESGKPRRVPNEIDDLFL